jgi:hypothetical protein
MNQTLDIKKLLVVCCTVLLLIACSSQEQKDLREALVSKLKDDSDLKDYKLEPATIADCVVGEITADLPGFPGDPQRERFYQAYVHFVNVKSPADADKSITDYQDLFGSVKQAREAATNITNHIMTCMGQAIEKSGGATH